MSEYIGNAKIINLSDIPQIGHKRNYLLADYVCIEVKIKEILDDYIIYEALYCEAESVELLDDFRFCCCHWSYAVSKKEFEGRSK